MFNADLLLPAGLKIVHPISAGTHGVRSSNKITRIRNDEEITEIVKAVDVNALRNFFDRLTIEARCKAAARE